MDDKERRALLLDKAADICVWKHAGQRDKNGDAYFMHPMRVALKCQTDEEKIVALLHDVLEDTDYTLDNLRSESFPENIIDAVVCITKDRKESYEDFIQKVKTNSLARVVKIHDLEDNLDALRLDSFNPEMAALFTKYIAARQFLLKEELISESLGKDDEDSVEEDTDQETKEESIDQGKVAENVHIPSDDDEEDEEDCVRYEVKRIVLSREQSHRDQRARINKRLSNLPFDKSEFMQNKIQILMPDRSIVCESSTYLSFIKVLEHIGFDTVADLNLKYKKYPIVTRTPYGAYLYKQANAFWYVLAKWPTIVAAQYVNKIADELDLCIECDVVPR